MVPKAKKKKKKITISEFEINRMKRQIATDATDKASLVILCAMVDELKATDDQLCAVAVRANRYAEYIDRHIVKLKEVQEIIEKNTGVTLKGWV